MTWQNPKLYEESRDNLVQLLCIAIPQIFSGFPRECDFPITSKDHVNDEPFRTIGFKNQEMEWCIAGWDITQDCWTDARYIKVLGWQPMAPITPEETST